VNAVDTATVITSDSESATLPASNLMSSRYGRIWRTSAATTAYFRATFAAATSVDVLALSGCTLSSTDTVRHRLYSSDGTTVLYDSGVIACGVLPGYALHVTVLSASYSATYWRCDVVATSRASLGYFDIARAWAGPVWTPSIGISVPWDEGWEDDADVVRAKRSGGRFVGDGTPISDSELRPQLAHGSGQTAGQRDGPCRWPTNPDTAHSGVVRRPSARGNPGPDRPYAAGSPSHQCRPSSLSAELCHLPRPLRGTHVSCDR
jgi:hypothetical protein